MPDHPDKLTLADVVQLGADMREAQRVYFRSRTQEALTLSKRAERAFDTAARRIQSRNSEAAMLEPPDYATQIKTFSATMTEQLTDIRANIVRIQRNLGDLLSILQWCIDHSGEPLRNYPHRLADAERLLARISAETPKPHFVQPRPPHATETKNDHRDQPG